jgi:tRNA A37 methylthiotransferase MiaB
VQHSIRKERTSVVGQVLAKTERESVSQRLGQNAKVLFESRVKLQGEWVWQGWSEDFLKVYTPSTENLYNQVRCVRLDDLTSESSIIGQLWNQSEDKPED